MMFAVFSKFKIRDKIAWLSIIQFIVVIIIIGFVLNVFVSRLVNKDVKNNFSTIAHSKSNHLETYFEGNIQLLQLVTSRTALRKAVAHYNETGDEADLVTITNIIKDAIVPIPQFERICILGLTGTVLASTNEKFCGKDISQTKFFEEGKKAESINFVKEDNVYKIYISGPMKLDGNLIGVGMTVLSLNGLVNIVRESIGLGETGEVLVAFLNDTGEREYPVERLFEEEAITESLEGEDTAYPMKQALAGKEVFFEKTFDYRNKQVVAATAFVDIGRLGLVVKIDKSEILEVNRQLLLLFVIIFIIFVLIYYFLSKLTAKIISKPIINLYHGTKEVNRGNFDFKVGTQVQDEVGELSRSFDAMVESVKRSREEVDKKVEEQTREIQVKAQEMSDQKKAIFNILEDVEEEKNKAEILAIDLEKFKLAVEEASDHILITDGEGIILYANKAVERITGFSQKEIIGQKAGVITNWGGKMGEKFYQKMWGVLKKNKKVFVGEIKNHRKNGDEYIAFASVSPIKNENDKVIFFVAIERDITREKQIDQAKTEFVSLASHQLRTPLSTINWYAEMLLNGDAGKLKPEQAQYLDEIYRGNQRMVVLVNSLLNVSRLELGTFVVEPKLLDITKIADQAIDDMSHKMFEKKQFFEKVYDKNLKPMMLDEKLVGMVFQNLLSNAMKYTPEKGKIKLEIKIKGKMLEIIVGDSGMGIPTAQQDKIFTKLFRADNVRASDTEGTGLGLYIIKSIVDHAGGKIWFTSKENKGTTFYVNFPVSGMKKKNGDKTLS